MPIQKIYQELDQSIPSLTQKQFNSSQSGQKQSNTTTKNSLDIPDLLQRTLPIRQKRCKTIGNSPNNKNQDMSSQFRQMYHNFNNYEYKQQKKQSSKVEKCDKQKKKLDKNTTNASESENQEFLKENLIQAQQKDEINSRQSMTPIQPARVFVTDKGKLINDRFDIPTYKPVSFAESIKKQNADLSLIDYFQTGKDKIIEHLDYKDITDNNITNFNNNNKLYIQNLIDKHQKHMKPQCCSKGEQVRADSALKNYRNQLDEEIDKFYKNLEQKSLTPSIKYQKPIKKQVPYKDGLIDEYFFKDENNQHYNDQDLNYQNKSNQNNDKGAGFFKKYIQDVDLEKYKELPLWVKVATEKQDFFPKIQSPSKVSQYIQNGVLPMKSVLEKSEFNIHQKKKKYIRKIEKIVTECDDYKQSNY
ncbi:hypothetical protein TTHERM_00139620 (macronuclear) [Tetrahymena thermophila SB210]|uniref:Uncharacterized protein n=1 Tax=Tetrahymena thermophila (strain SB210) TaxID=312017 RepID=I7MFB9_TETTS|nr:hypothetical protein TTHERM_00139620 [Tetrahymena thermophila SB210]EAR99600.2 hypothetical protein TTHERM_00139620 [Tetrahymena thermophila SB210]|eukprot:XP_001019845.2 hypothetical protein TTHERM_00139620 [Tetrahymena thermophila SB210]